MNPKLNMLIDKSKTKKEYILYELHKILEDVNWYIVTEGLGLKVGEVLDRLKRESLYELTFGRDEYVCYLDYSDNVMGF